MTVRAQFLVSAFVILTGVGFYTRVASTEPLNASGVVRSALSYDQASGTSGVRMSLAGLATRKAAHVASATRQLDLSKLTMADFGDVEPSR